MEKKVSVEISARHVHLSEEVYKKLFGEDAEMTSVKDLTGGGAVKIHRYDTGASDVSIQYMKVGELAAAHIKNNQGYQTYEFKTTIPAEGMTDSSPFVYFLDDWSFQNAQMAKDLKTLAGKTVTISLSMKVVGELSNATVYIDRVQILSVCEDYLNEDGSFNVETEESKKAFDELASLVTIDKVTDLEGLTGGGTLEGYQQL